MHKIIGLVFLLISHEFTHAQQSYVDSLQRKLRANNNDTIKLVLFGKLADAYSELKPDSAYIYADKMLSLSRKLNLPLEESVALGQVGYAFINLSNYPRSLKALLEGVAIAEDPASEKNVLSEKFDVTDEFTDRKTPAHVQRLSRLSRVLQYIGILYSNTGNLEKGNFYFDRGLRFAKEAGNLQTLSITYTSLGRNYISLKKFDSAMINLRLAHSTANDANYLRYLGSTLLLMGRVHVAEGKAETAKEYFRQSIKESLEHGYTRGALVSNLLISDIFKKAGEPDSSLYYLNRAFPTASYLNSPDILLRFYTALADYYKTSGQSDSIVKYQSLIIKMNDSLFNAKQTQQFQNIDFDEQQRLQQADAAKTAYQNKIKQYSLLAGGAVVLLIAFILYRNNRQKQKDNLLLAKQKEKIESTLIELRSTQKQLIQSEKMASLGELTAGIAHEIQNPLNFVNNFSDVNKELAEELKAGLAVGNLQLAAEIANDIQENSEKINNHGKRADAIVKGMLAHSHKSDAEKKPTDVNALADEYLRLAYHGFRAKEKLFTATLQPEFDKSIGNINIIPQDIGKVILNIVTNAFYAVNEKNKRTDKSYQPTVSLITTKIANTIQISIKDNGNGVPPNIIDKIFQPFFTTKPTGQGTGLGLSLAYDIVKAHGGSLKVNTNDGDGTEFIVILPID